MKIVKLKLTWIASALILVAVLTSACESNEKKNYDVGGTDNDHADKNMYDTRGALATQLQIPISENRELSVDGTELKSIIIDDKDIIVPDKDCMYTKNYNMVSMTAEDKKKITSTIFDEGSGIHNYPKEYFDDIYISNDMVDKIFDERDSEPDFNGEYFVGMIDDVPYVVRFMYGDGFVNEGFAIVPACQEKMSGELRDKQITQITYSDYDPEDMTEYSDLNEIEESEKNQVNENVCGLNTEQAVKKGQEYLDELGIADVTETTVTELYRIYEDDAFNMIQSEKDGYKIRFDASVNGVCIYQPLTMAIDTITKQSSNQKNNIPADNFYYSEVSYYELSFNENGIISFYGYFPMAGVGELKRVDNLISWSDAVDSLEKVIPKHFEDYKGYSKIVFNDVRLTYFRTLTENGQYKVMPVYVFSQVEEYDVNQPIQLIIIDARDGTEVNVMQDESRKGMVN